MSGTTTSTTRRAADGSTVRAILPVLSNEYVWNGMTRISGPNFLRNFELAESGEYRTIYTRLWPGARYRRVRQTGFDLLLIENEASTESCLVWAGPHNEARTWFTGPLPSADYLDSLANRVRFVDSPSGATMTPVENQDEQFATYLIAVSDNVSVYANNGETGGLPGQGIVRGSATLSKQPLDEASGTAADYKYIFTDRFAVYDVIFRQTPDYSLTEETVGTYLSEISFEWRRGN